MKLIFISHEQAIESVLARVGVSWRDLAIESITGPIEENIEDIVAEFASCGHPGMHLVIWTEMLKGHVKSKTESAKLCIQVLAKLEDNLVHMEDAAKSLVQVLASSSDECSQRDQLGLNKKD